MVAVGATSQALRFIPLIANLEVTMPLSGTNKVHWLMRRPMKTWKLSISLLKVFDLGGWFFSNCCCYPSISLLKSRHIVAHEFIIHVQQYEKLPISYCF